MAPRSIIFRDREAGVSGGKSGKGTGEPIGAHPLRVRRSPAPRGAAMTFIEHALALDTDDCILFPYGLNADGYANLRVGEGHAYGHEIVCKRAHGPRAPGYQVAHSCRTPACVNKRHLRWATHAENMADKMAHGTASRGRKLKPIGIGCIREDLAVVMRTRDIARMFGVSGSTVSAVIQRASWKQTPGLCSRGGEERAA